MKVETNTVNLQGLIQGPACFTILVGQFQGKVKVQIMVVLEEIMNL